MLPSLYTGVSGLKNHQTRMNVVANNISNVNTYGFKYSRVAFEDMLSMNMQGAAGPTERKGGVNPKQFGLGMSVASVDKIFTQGTMQQTNRKTDLAIDGMGFFVMKKGNETFFSRAGNFQLDKNGHLVNPHGYHVQGWQSEIMPDGTTRINTSAPTKEIYIPPVDTKIEARATRNIRFRSNLNGLSVAVTVPDDLRAAGNEQQLYNYLRTHGHVTTIDAYDSQGGVHQVQAVFYRDAADVDAGGVQLQNRWRARMFTVDPNTGDVLGYSVDPNTGTATANTQVWIGAGGQPEGGDTNEFILDFDTSGALVNVTDATGTGQLALQPAVDEFGKAITDAAGNPVQRYPSGNELSINLRVLIPGNDADGNSAVTRPQDITLRLGTSGIMGSGITQAREFSPEKSSTTKSVEQDGWTYGYVTDFEIDPNGMAWVAFDNGEKRQYGQVAMAVFANQEGLQKAGENNFVQTNNSGTAIIGPADTGSRGSLRAGTLEMSNVDLAEQFTDMIITQRGFQANSRSITTSDQMLQELLTLKR